MYSTREGGGYFVYLSDGDVPFFRILLSPIVSGTGIKEGNFSGAGCQDMSKGKILILYEKFIPIFSPIFVFWSVLLTNFFLNRVSFEGNNSGAG